MEAQHLEWKRNRRTAALSPLVGFVDLGTSGRTTSVGS